MSHDTEPLATVPIPAELAAALVRWHEANSAVEEANVKLQSARAAFHAADRAREDAKLEHQRAAEVARNARDRVESLLTRKDADR